MPQMAPMNWLTLFIFFMFIFIIFNSMTYFIYSHNPMKTNFNLKSSKINWKW
uniref:ATP synthase F0 subunit 8 n=1 Tax=Ptomascopus plagiatus TaxID=1035657 RepID=UPI0021D52F4B|nr:ATP synthase F0 subunit 8 [Ptomascopus plagiatus]UXC94688.1 ATP synthase F0 subunit 8 [Ptomascopus plagiatus]